MQCPACNNVNLAMTDRQGIEIDYCPNCRGVWLDRGELDRLIERAEVTTPPPRQGHAWHRDERHHDYRHQDHRHKRRKSLLGELFDF